MLGTVSGEGGDSSSYRVKEKEIPVGEGIPLRHHACLVQLPGQARYLRRGQKWQEGRGCGWEKKVGDSKWLYQGTVMAVM